MSSPWKAYWDRSLAVLRNNSARVLRAEADPAARPHLVYAINQQTNLKDFATGSDKDIGGQTECTLDVDENGDGRFWGELRREVRGEWRGKVRGGYAGFRNKALPSLFGTLHHDLSLYTHLALTIRPSGESQTWRHWFVNIQTDGPVRSDLFQHRLPLPSPSNTAAANKWQTIHIPLSSFVLTNSGALSETQITMLKNKVRTVGFSILGSERGKFELGIRKVEAVRRDEDEL
ncbi:hypothetical protein NCC49_005644 [Naganishia albida]|nr:hypothetical protein NCC49_005644 [Naganishia albida]